MHQFLRRSCLVLLAVAALSTAGRLWADDVTDAIAKGDADAVAKLIADNKDAINAKSIAKGPGWEMLGTPLHVAAIYGKTDIAKLLLDKGADPTEVDESGFTALHLAAWKGNKAMVDVLVAAKKTDVNALSGMPKKTALHFAIEGFPLGRPSAADRAAAIEALLKKGADPKIKDGDGATAIKAAEDSGEAAIVAAFKNAGAKIAEPAPSEPPLKGTVKVSFQLKHVILVKAKVNGKEGTFVFDTGASHNILLPSVAKAAGLSTSGFATTEVTLGEAAVKGQRFAVRDMPQLQPLKLMGVDYAGVLGYPFISQFVTTFDYRKKELTFAGKDSPALKAEKGDTIVDFTLNPIANLIFIKAKVNGSDPLVFLFDSGAQETFITPPVAKKLEIDGKAQITNIGQVKAAKAKSIAIGDVEVKNMPIMIANPPQAQMLTKIGQHYDGILGRTFFEKYLITLDYRDKKIRLTPFGE